MERLTGDTWQIHRWLAADGEVCLLNFPLLLSFCIQSSNPSSQMDKLQPMLLPEIQAALALAALARPSSPQDQEVASFHENNKYRMATSALISGVTDKNSPSKLCSKNNQCNSATKLRQNLTEADMEARRLRRILANRESARQTIRRRQAMHLELTRKAVDLSEENENLRKEKELAVEAYNSLKSRNKFLKLQVASANAESREMKEPKSSHAEYPTSAITSSPISSYNQPSLTPFSWPSVPSSNIIHFQYPSHLQSELQNSSLCVLPLPWILPFPSYGPVLHSCTNTEKGKDETPSAHPSSISSSSDNRFLVESKEFSSKDDVNSAIRARRRRKELMMLRNVKCHQAHTHTANSQV